MCPRSIGVVSMTLRVLVGWTSMIESLAVRSGEVDSVVSWGIARHHGIRPQPWSEGSRFMSSKVLRQDSQ